ncbi:45771_t:CDS:2, partial [Gigaspora margarita]
MWHVSIQYKLNLISTLAIAGKRLVVREINFTGETAETGDIDDIDEVGDIGETSDINETMILSRDA